MLLTGLMSLGLSTQAALIYDNSTVDMGQRFTSGLVEVGDEINFAGTERWVTRFNFEYFGANSGGSLFNGDVSVRVRFYKNDGALFSGYAAPGSLLWESAWFGISATPRDVLDFSVTAGDFVPTGLLVPNTLTWTVQFQGLGSGDSAGVDLFGPAALGATTASLRSTRRLVGATATMSRVRGSIVTSMSVSTRPKALELVTGTRRPAALARPVGRGVLVTTPPTFATSTVLAEQL